MKKFSFKLNDEGASLLIQSGYSRRILPLIAGLITLGILFAGCTDNPGDIVPEGDNRLVIACTIPPQEELITAVTGDTAHVIVMVPPGASPHTFEPSPSQIATLESADLYIALGSGIEFENRWLDRIRGMYPHLKIVNLSENLSLLPAEDHTHEEDLHVEQVHEDHDEHEQQEGHGADAHKHEGGLDPHVWLSLKNAARMVETIADVLSAENPEMKETYTENRDRYLGRISAVDESIRTSLSDLQNRKILVYHDAFGYFCRDYDLTQITVEVFGKEPSARTLAGIIETARKEGITIIFMQPEFSTKGADTLAAELSATVVLISPLAGDYLDNMQYIAERIAGR